MNTILRLSDVQQKMYDLIYENIRNGNYEINIPVSFPRDKAIILVKLVLGDHPEFINIDNCQVNLKYNSSFSKVVLNTVFSPGEYAMAKVRFDTEVRRILAEVIKPGKNPVQKVLAIHDYFVRNVKYDIDDLTRAGRSVLSHTAYGAIVNKCAVCEGISCAFAHLAHMAGIEATVVNGIADGENHSWNMVKLGNGYYHIDTTFDITGKTEGETDNYNHFCLDDASMSDRIWERKIYSPCTSLRFSYFTVTHAFAHNEAEMRDIMLRQYNEGRKVYFKTDFTGRMGGNAGDYVLNVFLDVLHKNGMYAGTISMVKNKENTIFKIIPG